MSSCGPNDKVYEELSLLNFSMKFMELIMLMADTTAIKSGNQLGIYRIFLGDKEFKDSSPEVAFKKMMYWLLTKDRQITDEELTKAVFEVTEEEAELSHRLINQLTEGGMSEFGKKIQGFRQDRGATILKHLDTLMKEPRPKDSDYLMKRLIELTGFQDLELSELVVAVSDWNDLQRLK